MKIGTISLIAAVLLSTRGSCQQKVTGPVELPPLSEITIGGSQIAGSDLVVRKGITYVSVPALTKALGASVDTNGSSAVLNVSSPAATGCGAAQATARLSDPYRQAAVSIPDKIETLRVLVKKREDIIPAARFDEVEREIFEADYRARTDADKSVSYALSHANNSLAIQYYRHMQGVTEAQTQDQLDSVLCSMESKFALQAGHLSGKENCSTFHLKE